MPFVVDKKREWRQSQEIEASFKESTNLPPTVVGQSDSGKIDPKLKKLKKFLQLRAYILGQLVQFTS